VHVLRNCMVLRAVCRRARVLIIVSGRCRVGTSRFWTSASTWSSIRPFRAVCRASAPQSDLRAAINSFVTTAAVCRKRRNRMHVVLLAQSLLTVQRMKLKNLPRVLILHLKRFKYMEDLQRHKKLCYRVVFPIDLKLRNTVRVY